MREEEEAVTSNGMNDDTTNIYSCSAFDNNLIGDDNKCNLNQISQVWGTWEELVLSCAVKRHGFTDWDSVAKEVRSRGSLNASPGNCRLKYHDLKRRFQDSVDAGGGDRGEVNSETSAEEDGDIPWLGKLRTLRVAELRREVQRCDDSILSLQLKVKKLEEEKDRNDEDSKPDLEDNSNAVRSLNNETEPARINQETSGSDRENSSMNELNSTASVDRIADHERLGGDKMVQVCENPRNPDPDPVYKVTAEEEGTVSRGSEMSHSGELGESGTSTGRGKRKRRKYITGEDSSIRGGSDCDIKSAYNKSQPLIEIIELIRSHPRGSLFEARLRSQGTKDYRRLIRQHLDIKTIEKKVENGSYVSSSLSFYRDLKLLFTNAIVFFPPSSFESMAAQELKTLVSNELKKETEKSAESSVSRQKSSVPHLVVCKKKNSAAKKTSSSSSLKQKDEKKSQDVSEEKIVSTIAGARSSKRRSQGISVVSNDIKTGRAKNINKKQTDSSNDDDDEKEEIPKTEKKDKKKSVADFLKRIKKNSPEKATSKNQKSDGNVKKEKSKGKRRGLRSNSMSKQKVEVGTKSCSKRKQPKKEAEATGKRDRESENEDTKQPKKRNRR